MFPGGARDVLGKPEREAAPLKKTALVSGATGAIGRATCAALLQQGATVIGLGRDPVKLKTLQGDLALFARRFAEVRLAGLSEAHWGDAIRKAVARHSPIDVYVHAMGTLIPGALQEQSERDVRDIIEANLLSVVWAVRAIAPHMIARGSGHIIAVASLGGLVPMPYQSLYSATKFAVRGLCLSLHEELRAHGVRVSLVSPGAVRSPMLDAEGRDPRAALAFVGRPASPTDVAAAIVGLIRRPRRELVTPALHRFVGAIVTAFPELFGFLFPHLQRLGDRRLQAHVPCCLHGQEADCGFLS